MNNMIGMFRFNLCSTCDCLTVEGFCVVCHYEQEVVE